MRSRISLLTLLLVAGSLALPLAAHAAIPFFDPIIPQSTNQCAAGWGLIMVVINNIISLGITLAIVFVAPLMIAYAGFLFVVNPVNAGGKAKAKSILLNTVVGIVIALAGWMIVDAVMAVLYDRNTVGETWSQLITTGGANFCIPLAGSLRPAVVPPPGLVVGVPGKFSFDPGISAQVSAESPALAALLSCMVTKVPAGVGRISSISDSKIVSGQYTFQQCAAQGSAICAHAVNSCHYGGTGSCNGSSYAVDFGDDENMAVLTSAAQACGARTLNEGTHLHATVGAASDCGCDTRI